MNRGFGRRARVVAATASTIMLTACAPDLHTLEALSPAIGAATVTLTAVFANALNLPSRAKVKLNGADIGEVTDIRARDFTAYVTMKIRQDVPLYEGSTAELRSATPMGDVFVALHSAPPSQAHALSDGALLPVGTTSAAATPEEVLSSAAILLNGGAIRHLVSIVNGAGSATGNRGYKLGELLEKSNSQIARLAARSEQIQHVMRSATDLAAIVSDNQQVINDALGSAAPATAAVDANVSQIIQLADSTSRITAQLSHYPSLQGTNSRSVIADLERLASAANEINSDPQLSMTALNRLIGIMMKSTNSTSAHADAEVTKLALGSLPDKNYPGDPAFHGPDGTDWHAMIGSLRYQWNLLLAKVQGPQR
ncbi:MlaD family protein [Mycobacteroides abscessus]|uniref:MlaD family protein n=1 Tax=Mycobacteroides abscessus TaxID=36809 RepID=UPI0021051616|nr:MlaD family protein [Mycobacteroides abscessus]